MVDSVFEEKAREKEAQSKQEREQELERQRAQLDSVTVKDGFVTLTTLEGGQYTFTLQTFPVFKTARVLQMLAALKDDIDIVSLISEVQTLMRPVVNEDVTGQAERVVAALNAIPRLLEVAPDLLLDFGALAIIPNKELRQAHDEGKITSLVAEKRRFLEFEFDASVPIALFSAYLPYLGLDFLRKALSTLNLKAAETLTKI